jgi:exonuclease VII small subunit
MAVTALIRIIADTEASQTSKSKKLSELSAFITRLESAELKSEYQVEKLLEQVRD